jgi:hypothetical protein
VEISIPSYRHDMVWLPTLLLPEVLIGLVICELRQSGRPGFPHVHSLGLGAAPARPHPPWLYPGPTRDAGLFDWLGRSRTFQRAHTGLTCRRRCTGESEFFSDFFSTVAWYSTEQSTTDAMADHAARRHVRKRGWLVRSRKGEVQQVSKTCPSCWSQSCEACLVTGNYFNSNCCSAWLFFSCAEHLDGIASASVRNLVQRTEA